MKARPDWIPVTALLREIQAAGHDGCITQLQPYLAPLKATPVDPLVRLSTVPVNEIQ